MTDDIAACPHSLAERETAVADGMCPICSADALSRRSTPPLPKEIAGLIEQGKQFAKLVREWNDYELGKTAPEAINYEAEAQLFGDMADALSRLTAPPLPKEIMGLIERLKHPLWQHYNDGSAQLEKDATISDLNEGAAALRALAQEIERLKAIIDGCDKEGELDEQRIAELEAERDAIRDELHKVASFIEPHWQGAGAKLEAEWIIRVIGEMNSEADAIRTKTIEECAKFFRDAGADRNKWYSTAEVVEVICALAQTDERKTESGE